MVQATASVLDGWAWHEMKALLLPSFTRLALILRRIDTLGKWPEVLLDAYVAIIPRTQEALGVLFFLSFCCGLQCALAILKGGSMSELPPQTSCWQRSQLCGSIVFPLT